jgi:hypothetical protein
MLLSRMWGTFALLLAFIVFYFMFKRLTEQKVDESQGPFMLQTRPEVLDSNVTRQLLNATNTGTLQAFVYPLQAQKTGTMVLCNPTGAANPGEPECSTGQYNLCKCLGNDCSKCVHSGYVNILNISNVIRVELLASPDAGRPNAASAQLVVRTLGMALPSTAAGQPIEGVPRVQTVFEETIALPDIPFQKWTFLTIAREGRRFDIYYNGKIVMSKRTQNVVDTRAGFGPITAGDPNLTGKIAFIQTFPQKLSQQEVLANYKAKSDTTGQPVISAPTNLFDYVPNCKGGGCITGPKMRPTSPLLDWQTQYA